MRQTCHSCRKSFTKKRLTSYLPPVFCQHYHLVAASKAKGTRLSSLVTMNADHSMSAAVYGQQPEILPMEQRTQNKTQIKRTVKCPHSPGAEGGKCFTQAVVPRKLLGKDPKRRAPATVTWIKANNLSLLSSAPFLTEQSRTCSSINMPGTGLQRDLPAYQCAQKNIFLH